MTRRRATLLAGNDRTPTPNSQLRMTNAARPALGPPNWETGFVRDESNDVAVVGHPRNVFARLAGSTAVAIAGEATDRATWRAIREVTLQAIWRATVRATGRVTRTATRPATWTATVRATGRATGGAMERATGPATRTATGRATGQAIPRAIRTATGRTTHTTTVRATGRATGPAAGGTAEGTFGKAQ